MNNCPIHDVPLRTRHTKLPPFRAPHRRRFLECPESDNNQCTYTDWLDESAGSSAQLSQGSNAPSTPSSSQARASFQHYAEAPSTPTPKRNFSTIDSDEVNVASSKKRLKIIQDALAIPAADGPQTPTGKLTNPKFNPAVGILSIKYDNPGPSQIKGDEPTSPGPSSPPRRSEPVASSSNEDPFQDSFTSGGHNLATRIHNDLSATQETAQDESSDSVAKTVTDVIRRLETLPDYIKKFESRKIAAEKSRDAKNTKMINLQHQVETLELEVQRLKAREKELEGVITAYEQQ